MCKTYQFPPCFHTLCVVVNQSFKNAMSVEVINDMWTMFIVSVWSEKFGSELCHSSHRITNII